MVWEESNYLFEVPVDGSTISDFILMGIDFGPFKEDASWRGANLPLGWRIEKDIREKFILDENGSKRAVIYLKNKIHMRPIRRFNYGRHNPTDPDISIRFCLWDSKVPYPQKRKIILEKVHSLPSRKQHESTHKTRGDQYFNEFEVFIKDWLAKRYPNWEDSTNYWNND